MTILVIGATGRVGRQAVHQLANRGADVRVLVRDPSKADFPTSMNVMQGDMLGIELSQRVPAGVRTLFLLNTVTGDELTQALLALDVARESGVECVVYPSVMYVERFANVPHFAMKPDAERTIEQMSFSATILRLAHFMDNEHVVKDVIVNHGVYPMPIGSKGVVMVDTRDIAEVAAIELIRRDAAPGKLPIETINSVDPDTLTGPELVSIWSETLGRPVAYGGDGSSGFETNLANFLPKWMAYETRLMAERYVSDGMVPQAGSVERLTRTLEWPLGMYRDFAATFMQ